MENPWSLNKHNESAHEIERGSVGVLIEHHPTKKGIFHLQQICEDDVQNPKKGHLPTRARAEPSKHLVIFSIKQLRFKPQKNWDST